MLWKFKAKLYSDWCMNVFGCRDKKEGWREWCENMYYDPRTHYLGRTPFRADTRWCKTIMTQKEMLTKVREW